MSPSSFYDNEFDELSHLIQRELAKFGQDVLLSMNVWPSRTSDNKDSEQRQEATKQKEEGDVGISSVRNFKEMTATDILDGIIHNRGIGASSAALPNGQYALPNITQPVAFRYDGITSVVNQEKTASTSTEAVELTPSNACAQSNAPLALHQKQTGDHEIDIGYPAWPQTKLELPRDWRLKIVTEDENGWYTVREKGAWTMYYTVSASSVPRRSSWNDETRRIKERNARLYEYSQGETTERLREMGYAQAGAGNKTYALQGESAESIEELTRISSMMIQSVFSPESAVEIAEFLFNLTRRDRSDRSELIRSIRIRLLQHFARVWIQADDVSAVPEASDSEENQYETDGCIVKHRINTQTCLGVSTLVGLLWSTQIAKENDVFFCVSRLVKSFRRPWRMHGLLHLLSNAGDSVCKGTPKNRIVNLINELETKVLYTRRRGYYLSQEVKAIVPKLKAMVQEYVAMQHRRCVPPQQRIQEKRHQNRHPIFHDVAAVNQSEHKSWSWTLEDREMGWFKRNREQEARSLKGKERAYFM